MTRTWVMTGDFRPDSIACILTLTRDFTWTRYLPQDPKLNVGQKKTTASNHAARAGGKGVFVRPAVRQITYLGLETQSLGSFLGKTLIWTCWSWLGTCSRLGTSERCFWMIRQALWFELDSGLVGLDLLISWLSDWQIRRFRSLFEARWGRTPAPSSTGGRTSQFVWK